MITLRPVTETEPMTIACPGCGATLATATEHRLQMAGQEWLYEDGDLLEVALGDREIEGLSFDCQLLTGRHQACGKSYIGISVMTVKGEADEAFVQRFFFKNDDTGTPTHFAATRGKRAWLVERLESELGPVLGHTLGPIAWDDMSWVGSDGVSLHHQGGGSPWAFAAKIVRALWPDLRRLTLRDEEVDLDDSDVPVGEYDFQGEQFHDDPWNAAEPRDAKAIKELSSKWDRRYSALALYISGWSKDPKAKVGAVLLDERTWPIALGYNGFPSGVTVAFRAKRKAGGTPSNSKAPTEQLV